MSLDNAVPVAPGDDYTAENTQVLRNRDHIRKRPDNYIPDTGPRGLHHLVYELVYNSVDEHLAGYCKSIQVAVLPDGGLSVADDGRGIPVDEHPTERKSNAASRKLLICACPCDGLRQRCSATALALKCERPREGAFCY